jgi:DNA-binding transcriptional MerR regulator
MTKDQNRNYSIGETARICGVTEKQIRHWELKGLIPPAKRVVCGKRAYREFGSKDLELIRRIKRNLEKGFTLSTAARNAAGKNREITGGPENGRQ